MNVLEYAAVFQSELDKAAVQSATSGWMELNSGLVKYEGGREVKIPMMSMDGLADYDRQAGFVDGSVNLSWQTMTMDMDRGRRFTFDEHEVSETNFILTAGTVMGEFQRTRVVPEIDAYRYSKLASIAKADGKVVSGYTPAKASILEKLYLDIATVQDKVGSDIPLVITMSTRVAALFSLSTELQRHIDVTDFTKGDVTIKTKSLDGVHPIIPVSAERLKTEYVFLDGKSTSQEPGGFKAGASAKSINWLISPRNAPIAVSRTDNVRIFTPETYQPARAWATDYRKYHDLWVPKNRAAGILANLAP